MDVFFAIEIASGLIVVGTIVWVAFALRDMFVGG